MKKNLPFAISKQYEHFHNLSLVNICHVPFRDKRGITLIELMLYMGLMSIFLVVLTQIFVSILDVQAESESFTAVEQDSRFLLSRLQYDILRANTISTPAALGQTAASLQLDIAGVTYSYSLSNSNLQFQDNVGTFQLNGSDTEISTVTFQKLGTTQGKPSIKITMTVNSKRLRAGQPESKTVTTTFSTRPHVVSNNENF